MRATAPLNVNALVCSTPTLAQYLAKAPDGERVPVAIWLVEPERVLGERPVGKADVATIDKLLQAWS